MRSHWKTVLNNVLVFTMVQEFWCKTWIPKTGLSEMSKFTEKNQWSKKWLSDEHLLQISEDGVSSNDGGWE